MDIIRQHYSRSVMSYITLSLISIIVVALLTIFTSFWITELSDKDAQAINLSGSMRMQTYRIGLVLQTGDKSLSETQIKELDDTWNHTLFTQQRLAGNRSMPIDNALDAHFREAYDNWRQYLQPMLLRQLNTDKPSINFEALETQVELTDRVVNQFQIEAENKIKHLRSFQLLALLSTIGVGALIFYLLKNRLEIPLSDLMKTVHRFGKGDYSQRARTDGRDELGMLGAIFNQMSSSIQTAYNELEQRVNERTLELHQKNTTLQFLFNIAQKIFESQQHSLDYQEMVDELSRVLHSQKMELCLFTEKGEQPYLHIAPRDNQQLLCGQQNCGSCKGIAPFCKIDNAVEKEHYPISREDRQYGVISVSTAGEKALDSWQEQLLRATADQIAIALSLGEQEKQERRLAMLNERTVIARELHDSLAQALSYLQIQVTRLQRCQDREKFDAQPPIIEELREGLSSAYKQLRELLTTFRLKIDADGLHGAMENTVRQLLERSDMRVELNYHLSDVPLSSMEEIHLLQIMREASQNAIHHSKGECFTIALHQSDDHSIELKISDDGIGIQQSPEKLNHYGLAIMNERSRHLKGHIDISVPPEGGTLVRFRFLPEYLRDQETQMLKHEL
jgi:two-component system nitrate/nitrite sensor histidine kinase NarX